MMDCWIVLSRGTVDDLPLGVFSGEKEARDFASTVTPEDAVAMADEPFGMDASPEAVTLVTLVKVVGGRPVEVEHVRDFDAEAFGGEVGAWEEAQA